MVILAAASARACRFLLDRSPCHMSVWLKSNYSTKKEKVEPWPRKVISGVQPTGVLHLGNYFGAVKRWVDLQDEDNDLSFFIADMHSLTLPQDPAVLRQSIFQIVATLLACGIDPAKANLFVQSTVPQHAELCWILTCLTTMARLAHLPQYKEKSATLKDIPTGLYVYPILQAADILVHKATHVPTGDDQVQQLQLAQHLAKIFNTKYGRTFPIINGLVEDGPSSRIRSLRDPTRKQSKSDPDAKSRITLLDPPDLILERVKKSITDFTSEVTYDPENRPGVANLITIHSLSANLSVEEICRQNQDIDTGKYKLVVADAVIAHFDPIRLRILDYLKHPDHISTIIKNGGEKARETAEKTLQDVKAKVGLNVI